MSNVPSPPDSGQPDLDAHPSGHTLGPHVVGQRIVVRRLLRGQTGPTGGPAFTDLLGICVEWTAEGCVVRAEQGEPVRIALADIVSGKPVPPRPAVRHRVSSRDAESHTGALWPAVERVALGEWEQRFDLAPVGRRLKRANSCLAIGDPGRPIGEALAAVAAFYAARDREPLLQIEVGSEVEAQVLSAGWQSLPHGEADFLMGSIALLRRKAPASTEHVDLAVSGPRAVASVGNGCDNLAEGQGAVDGDWLGLHAVLVDAAHRRRGLARAVVRELLDWGAEQGAMTAWLHVETDNRGAREFWTALGFAVHHTCRYYAPASPSSASPTSR